MKTRLAFAVAFLVVGTGLSACSDQPTGVSPAASEASYDGGLTLGSGNRTGSDSTQTTPTATTTSDSTQRGGLTLGSGN
jgi:hypothetical protein